MSRRKLIFLSLAFMALSACNKGSVEAKNGSEKTIAEKVAAADNVELRAGQWETTFKMDAMNNNVAVPSVAKAAIERAMVSAQTALTCITPEQAKAHKGAFMQHQAGCTYNNFAMAGGHIEGTATCDAGGIKRTIKMSGQYTPDSYLMHIDTQMQRPGGMSVYSSMTMAARRTGDCTGKEAG